MLSPLNAPHRMCCALKFLLIALLFYWSYGRENMLSGRALSMAFISLGSCNNSSALRCASRGASSFK